MAPVSSKRVLIIGGGVTGLAIAHRLRKLLPAAEIRLVEARAELGGNIRTQREGGFVIDAGPDSFITTKPEALQLSNELGLGPGLISTQPACRKLWFVRHGQLIELPEGMALGIPTRILPILKSPLLSWRGRLRALLEPLVPPSQEENEETLVDFFARRAGREIAESIAGPMLSGIFAGEPSELSLQGTFPQLRALEKRYGSLAFGSYAAQSAHGSNASPPLWRDLPQPLQALHMLPWALRSAEPLRSPFASFEHGMSALVEALVRASTGVTIDRETAVRRLASDGRSWRAELAQGDASESWRGEQVIVACPLHDAARFMADPELARLLSAFSPMRTATIALAFERRAVAHPLNGLGVVVPKGEGRISAITFSSSKWPGRAPAECALLRTYLGGAREPSLVSNASDAELLDIATGELRRLLGRLEEPVLAKVFRYVRPQPTLGHVARIRALRARVGMLPGLWVASSGLEGVGIPDCVRQAEATARDVASRAA